MEFEPLDGGKMAADGARGYAIRLMRDDDAVDVLSVLNDAFDRRATMDWFRWKHQEAPWGPSGGWVATNPEGVIVGVRLVTPWAVTDGTSRIPITRAMDGAIAPSAQRRGLFSRLVTAEMELMASGGRDSRLLYSTSVPASREAYRKLGWEIRDVPHVVSVVAPALVRAVQLEWDDALEFGALPASRPGTSAWTVEALRWRIDRRSGYDYHTVRLRNSDSPHGVILRRTQLKGVPTVVVVFAWGSDQHVATAVRAASTRLAAPLVLSVGVARSRLSRPVGSSTVSAWGVGMNDPASTLALGDLCFDFADVEGVM